MSDLAVEINEYYENKKDNKSKMKVTSTKSLYKEIFPKNSIREFKPLLKNEKLISAEMKNGEVLFARKYEAKNAKRIILVLTDKSDLMFIKSLTELLNDETTVIVTEQNSPDENFTYGLKERYNVISWLDFIRNKISSELSVYLYGVGIGGITALMASGMKMPSFVHGIIVDSVPSSPNEYIYYLIKERYGEENCCKYADKLDKYLMENHGFSMHDYSIKEAMKTVSRPVLFFHGRKDKTIPVRMAINNYNLCMSEKEMVACEKAEHLRGLYIDTDRYFDKLNQFFEKYDSKEFSDKISLHYPEKTMYQLVEEAANRLPDDAAYNFRGSITTYKEMMKRIDKAAKAFVSCGIGEGDVVTFCMPNLPQSVDCIYALNKIGATASLIHPLSAESEITYYINISKSKMILTPDLFYEKVAVAVEKSDFTPQILVARIQDEINHLLKTVYYIKKGKDYMCFPDERGGVLWSDFVSDVPEAVGLPQINYKQDRTAVILYSGGTTGEPKGICLSDMNLNALAMQARVAMECEFSRGLKNLSAMPIFHGFGLGIGIHTVLINNACCVLMPQVNTKEYTRTLLKDKPNFIAGVPTIFKMLIESDDLKGKDLSFLKGMFVGGDSMPAPLKKDVDKFLKEHGASIQVREGYGLTECVTASCLTPKDTYKENSIGLPFPDTYYKIVEPDTDKEVPKGNEGEIVISGPTVMLGYLNNEEETKKVLKTHSDGKVWLHTGDLGFVDADGYVYYKQRIKRLIVSSGYNIYPSQVEKAIESYPDVDYCCVIGVSDEFKMERIKAYIVLKDGITGTEKLKKTIIDHCKKHIASYELPREIEFRDELPKTLVGKVAYRKLEQEEKAS